jgi:hypothetical protein
MDALYSLLLITLVWLYECGWYLLDGRWRASILSREDHRKHDAALEEFRQEQRRAMAERKARPRYGWDFGIAVFGAGIQFMVTDVWPWPPLFWVGAGCVYIGAVLFARHFWNDIDLVSRHPRIRKSVAGFLFLIFVYYWSTKVVFASLPIQLDAQATIGDYPYGMEIAGMKWNPRFSELRINLTNATDYDFKDVRLTVSSDLLIADLGQLESVCEGFNKFSGIRGGYPELTDRNTGETSPALANSGSISHEERVVCGTFPHRSTVTLVVALLTYDMGKSAIPSFPAAKRLPAQCSIKGDYRALGRTRDLDSNFSFKLPAQK